jgi:hypothetical protein
MPTGFDNDSKIMGASKFHRGLSQKLVMLEMEIGNATCISATVSASTEYIGTSPCPQVVAFRKHRDGGVRS